MKLIPGTIFRIKLKTIEKYGPWLMVLTEPTPYPGALNQNQYNRVFVYNMEHNTKNSFVYSNLNDCEFLDD